MKDKKKPADTVQFTIKVPRELRQRFHQVVVSQDKTSSQLIRSYMRDYIKQYGQTSLL